MSINDMMKLQGVGAVSRATSGEQGATLQKADIAKEKAARPSASGGVAVEVKTKIDAGKAPVETERVEKIRTALKEGRYPIVPAEIADAMIAARLSLVVSS